MATSNFPSGERSSMDHEKAQYSNHSDGGAPFNGRNITPGGHPLDQSQPAFPTYHRRFANPAPLGLAAFSLTTFVLSIINVNAAGVKTPNIVVGLALFYGGLMQLLAGMWEFAVGNTFGATVFSSYAVLVASLRSSIALSLTVFWLTIALLMLATAEFVPSHAVGLGKAGGWFGLLTAFTGWYTCAGSLLTPDTSFFILPVGDMSKKD